MSFILIPPATAATNLDPLILKIASFGITGGLPATMSGMTITRANANGALSYDPNTGLLAVNTAGTYKAGWSFNSGLAAATPASFHLLCVNMIGHWDAFDNTIAGDGLETFNRVYSGFFASNVQSGAALKMGCSVNTTATSIILSFARIST